MDKKLSFYLNNSNFKETTKIKKKPTEIRRSNNKDTNLLKIVNGVICLDDNDMYVNLNRNEDMEVLEDTGVITSSTYSKKRNFVRWTKNETEYFFDALSLCGFEFTLISELFPDKDRKSCRLKYTNELRRNASRIDKAIKNKIPFCPEKFASLKEKINSKYKNVS
ncbi:hypothetical protein P3W45_001093 [Vairimorpha bombi]|jgi:hypothetical protein